MSLLIDTHAHIDLPDFDADREVVMQRALDAGIGGIVAIGFNPERWRSTRELADHYPHVRRTVGLHPNNATMWSDDLRTALREELASDDVVAVGEIGLDFFRDHASRDLQRRCFADQLKLAMEASLPIVIHQRSAEADLLEILRPFAPVSGVLHCFSGDTQFAGECLQMGLHLGVGGVFTYPKSDGVRRAVTNAPLERILLETDSPYLAPQGQRGKRNEPANVRLVADRLAEERSVALSTIAEVTTGNAMALFGGRLEGALNELPGSDE